MQRDSPGVVALLGALIAGEARGEPVAGQVAVAWVVRNRVARGGRRWPSTYDAVMLQPWQFSTFNPIAGDQWDAARTIPARLAVTTDAHMLIARAVVAGILPDPTAGADHYFNPSLVMPSWSDSMTTTGTIGGHLFKREG